MTLLCTQHLMKENLFLLEDLLGHIRTLKNKIYKHITSISKSLYTDTVYSI